MRKLKKVGFFNELAHGEVDHPSLRGSMNLLPERLRGLVLAYLGAGKPILFAPKIVRDILDRDSEILGSLSIVSDGTWAWPSDLQHYVSRYRVGLPKEFLDHIEINAAEPISFDVRDVEL